MDTADAVRTDPAAVSRSLAKARIDVGLPLFERRDGTLTAQLDAMRGAEAGVMQVGIDKGYVAGLRAGTLDIGTAFNPAPATRMKLWPRRAVVQSTAVPSSIGPVPLSASIKVPSGGRVSPAEAKPSCISLYQAFCCLCSFSSARMLLTIR